MTEMTALDTLLPGPLSLAGHRLGTPQQAGALTMVPISGPSHPGFVPPRTGLKLTGVPAYGQVELTNAASSGVAIVPLHIGYIQDGAQNHALCRSAFLAAGQTLRFDDACCVQQGQGGYLAGRDQWFFVLPVELRARALELRGVSSYSKLWHDIADLNVRHGLPRRGHLEQILSRKRPVLTQFQSRLEPQPGQIGALFLVSGAFAAWRSPPAPATSPRCGPRWPASPTASPPGTPNRPRPPPPTPSTPAAAPGSPRCAAPWTTTAPPASPRSAAGSPTPSPTPPPTWSRRTAT
ncbi:ARPP-1 family domain-containing protein [Actinomadura madurae]|uniref:ARPP-1 family domain-containing protein n=1 Tax=Actinomadura madurae TaxID=1993 RepID=UPI0020D22295|nr:hypothetical protein [Actinomadura madurae]MCP9964335.1 hypothetical protein [Actinomadura madurae]MCP9976823.1 hypothetical protein [Actinomadura madurae]